MIFDCFTFFDELDILEIRLNELSPYVDFFVLVESNLTFTGNEKPLYFQQNKHRFRSFQKKIIHIPVTNLKDPPIITNQPPFSREKEFQNNPVVWSREFYQRNCITRGLNNANPDDIIIIGDVDEIPNTKIFKNLKIGKKPLALRQKVYYYYLNNLSTETIIGPKIVRYQALRRTTPQLIRSLPQSEFQVINTGGWHFTYLGKAIQIQKKINSFSHQELNRPEINNHRRINFNLDNNLDIFNRPFLYKTVKIDASFPATIFNKQKKYQRLIRKKVKFSVNTRFLIEEISKNRQSIMDQSSQLSLLKNKVDELQTALDNKNREIQKIFSTKTWKLFHRFQYLKSLWKKIK